MNNSYSSIEATHDNDKDGFEPSSPSTLSDKLDIVKNKTLNKATIRAISGVQMGSKFQGSGLMGAYTAEDLMDDGEPDDDSSAMSSSSSSSSSSSDSEGELEQRRKRLNQTLAKNTSTKPKLPLGAQPPPETTDNDGDKVTALSDDDADIPPAVLEKMKTPPDLEKETEEEEEEDHSMNSSNRSLKDIRAVFESNDHNNNPISPTQRPKMKIKKLDLSPRKEIKKTHVPIFRIKEPPKEETPSEPPVESPPEPPTPPPVVEEKPPTPPPAEEEPSLHEEDVFPKEKGEWLQIPEPVEEETPPPVEEEKPPKSPKKADKKHEKKDKPKKSKKSDAKSVSSKSSKKSKSKSSSSSKKGKKTKSSSHLDDEVKQRLHKARQLMAGLKSTKKTKQEIQQEYDDKSAREINVRPPENVFAKKLSVKPTYQPPVHKKTKEEAKTIEKALSQVLPTMTMPYNSVRKLISAFQRKDVQEGEEVKVVETVETTENDTTTTSAATPSGAERKSTDSEQDFFYVVQQGSVSIKLDGREIGEAKEGDTIGDANLYHSAGTRQKSSFFAKTRASLFRVDQDTYRSIMQAEQKRTDLDKVALIKEIKLFQYMSDANQKKLADALQAQFFTKGDTVIQKGKFDPNTFYVVGKGSLRCHKGTSIDKTGKESRQRITSVVMERPVTLGEEALMPDGEKVALDKDEMYAEAEESGVMYYITREMFELVIGKPYSVMLTPGQAKKLREIDCLRYKPSEKLTMQQLAQIMAIADDVTFQAGEVILQADEETPAALYFVRSGTIKVRTGRFHKLLIGNSVFGEELFEMAKASGTSTGTPKNTVEAKEESICSVLKLSDYLALFDTDMDDTAEAVKAVVAPPEIAAPTNKSKSDDSSDSDSSDSSSDEKAPESKQEKPKPKPKPKPAIKEVVKKPKTRAFRMENLEKMAMLGEGQFGQVWLVTDKSEKPRKAYALKVQSKFELWNQNQAEVVIREKRIMFRMNHPNIIKLFCTSQDDDFLYLVLDFINGGELFSLIYPIDNSREDGIPEEHARFYAFILGDVLKYIHSKHYVFRDLKPENVLINAKGYPVLVDFGFAKNIQFDGKSFTLCGTPGYLAPEMVTSAGHSYAVDHWALGIMTYEMICKENYFFLDGMDFAMLYKSIAEDPFEPPIGQCSNQACDFMDSLLQKEPVVRLGSLAGGEHDVIEHPWFEGMNPKDIRTQKLKAPWVPQCDDPFDNRHFDDWSDIPDKTTQDYPAISKEEQEIFEDFETS